MRSGLFAVFCFFISAISTAFAEVTLTPLSGHEARLDHLKTQIERELDLLNYPPRPWLQVKKTSDGAHIYDVVIVGGGQNRDDPSVRFTQRKGHKCGYF